MHQKNCICISANDAHMHQLNDALRIVCDVMIGVAGNPKMAALGADMQKRLETGNCGM